MNSLPKIKDLKGQKIIFLNVRSLYGHFSQLEAEFKQTNFMGLCFSETWLNDKIPDGLISIQGYNLVRLDRKLEKRGGGLIIYLSKRYDWEYLDLSLNVSNEDLELMSVLIKRPCQKDICLSLAYVPPKSNLNRMTDCLDSLANKINEHGTEWVLGGDLNVDFLSKSPHNRKLRIIGNFAKRNTLTQLISKPTRSAQTTSSLLDHIYCNNIDNVSESGVVTYGLSDHDITYTILKRNLPNKERFHLASET